MGCTKGKVFYIVLEWLGVFAGVCAFASSVFSAIVVKDSQLKTKFDIVNASLILASLVLGKVSRHLYGVVQRYKALKKTVGV